MFHGAFLQNYFPFKEQLFDLLSLELLSLDMFFRVIVSRKDTIFPIPKKKPLSLWLRGSSLKQMKTSK